jgi:hypothetical protein
MRLISIATEIFLVVVERDSVLQQWTHISQINTHTEKVCEEKRIKSVIGHTTTPPHQISGGKGPRVDFFFLLFDGFIIVE